MKEAGQVPRIAISLGLPSVFSCQKGARGRTGSPPITNSFGLLRRQFLGFALVTHHFESALRLFVCRRDFRLYLGRGLFHLGREAHVAVVLHAGAGRDQAADDDVLLESAQVIDRSLNGSFGEHARGLLEGRRRDERVGRERSLRDAEEQRAAGSRLAALLDHALVLFAEVELIQFVFQQERGVAHVLDLHPAHHLTDNHFDVLVADVDALQPVDFLDFVHQVGLQLFFAEHSQNVVRVERAIHERFARLDALAFLHVNVNAARHRVFFLRAVVSLNIEFALAFRHLADLRRAIDFADDGGLVRLARFKQLDHTRQTTGDVFGLGGFAGDLGQHIAGGYGVAVLHHKVRAGRHQVAFAGLAFDHDGRLPLLIGRIAHDVPRQSGDLVHFFVKRYAFLQVLKLRRTADFREDGEGVWIPLDHNLTLLHRIAVVDLELGAVDHGIALALAVFLVHDRDRALAVHHHKVARLRLYRLQADEAHGAVVFGIEARLLGNSRGRAPDVEGTHGELRSRLADGLRSDHARGFAEFYQAARGQIAAVAHDADAALGFASEHRANLHSLDS